MAFLVLLSPALSAPFSFADNATVELVGNLEVKKCRIILRSIIVMYPIYFYICIT